MAEKLEKPVIELVTYKFYLDDPKDRKEYYEMRKVLESAGYECFCVISLGKEHRIPAGKYEIDTKFLFNNQYDTVETDDHPGYRIFDWFERYTESDFKVGHYIKPFTKGRKLLDEIKVKRAVCRFCGAQYEWPFETGYCTKCRGSQYLTPDKYWMLRLSNVNESYKQWAKNKEIPLPNDVLADIAQQQKIAAQARLEAAIERRLKRMREKKRAAELEYSVIKWLIDKGFTNIENLIFYAHSMTFCLGWRERLTNEDLKFVYSKINDFPKVFPMLNFAIKKGDPNGKSTVVYKSSE